MRVHFDQSCTPGLRAALLETPSLFAEATPADADALIFGTDEPAEIANNAAYRAHRAKSICITESDIPNFLLPGLYAANMPARLTKARTRTISYFISERERGNADVKRLRGQQIERRYLYSFMGGANSWPRKRLFKAIRSKPDTIIEATDAYNHWTTDQGTAEMRASRTRRYAEIMAASKFTLCPRGCGLSSYRLFESMSLGVAPVIISDAWQPIAGIDWDFALRIRERDIPELDRIVRRHESEWAERGQAGLRIYESFLAEDVVARMLHTSIVDVLAAYDPRREFLMAGFARTRTEVRAAYWMAYRAAKYTALWGFHLVGKPVPIPLNRPLEVQLNRPASEKRGRT